MKKSNKESLKRFLVQGRIKYIWVIELIFLFLITIDILIGVFVNNKTWVIVFSTFLVWLMLSTIAFYLANSLIRGGRSKISWLLAFICLPIISHLLFFIWASNPFKYPSKLEYIERTKPFYENIDSNITNNYLNNKKFQNHNSSFLKIFNITNNLMNNQLYDSYNLEIIDNPSNLFNKSLELINEAQNVIFLNYYIIKNGFWFNEIKKQLIEKANQGVKIFIIYDWYGSFNKINKKDIKELANTKNIYIAKFKPKSDFVLRWTNNFRSHEKLLLIDNKKAIYGGSNISDEYLNMTKNIYNWTDLNFIVSGAIIEKLAISFCLDWEYYSKIIYSKDKNYKLYEYLNKNNLWIINNEVVKHNKNENDVAFYAHTCPDFYPFLLDNLLYVLFSNAKKEIKIITPYFLPTTSILNAFRAILTSGIKIKLILPGKPDNKKIMVNINRSYYYELIELGCEIYEYPGFIHAKLLIVDDKITSIGTYNFDLRSLLINFESSIFFNDQNISKNLSKTFDNLLKVSNFVDYRYYSSVYNWQSKTQVYISQIFAGLL